VLVGEKPGAKWREPLERGASLLLEEHLPKEGFLTAEAKKDDGTTSHRVAELLGSEDQGNISLALEMMKTGGVPVGVFEELFLAYQRTAFDPKIRAAAKKLFFAHAPLQFRTAVEKSFRGTSIYFSGDTKTKSRIKTLVKESRGTLDGSKLALLVGCLKYVFDEVKDPDAHLRALEVKRSGDTLDLISRELRSLPPAFARLEGIKKLGLAANHFARIPDVVFSLTGLRELDVSSNQLEELPRALTKLEELEVLVAGSNRITKFPSVVFDLKTLRRLDVSTELWGLHVPFTSLPARIAELDRLEELALRAHTFETLPPELLALGKLKKLDLSSAELKSCPEWLADLPSLEELDVRMTKTRAEALDRVAARLLARGVAVLR
jgi:hypothetical protein